MTSSPRKRVVLIVNPRASAVSHRIRSLVASGLRSRFEVALETTESQGHATEIARRACAEGVDAVVALGGDGTANEAANGLDDPNVPLVCLPGGSANVFCGVLGAPREIAGATRSLLRRADDWRTRRVDFASVNGRRFLFNSGVGLDARVVEGVDARPDLKARWRQWWFVTQAARTLVDEYAIKPPTFQVKAPGLEAQGIAGIVQNGRPWTYFGSRPVSVSNQAGLQTGLLSLAVLKKPLPWEIGPLGWRVLSGRGVDGHRCVTTHDAQTLEFRPVDGSSIPLHVDGDHIGNVDEAIYRVEPGGLSVLV